MCGGTHEFAGIVLGIKTRLDSIYCQLEPGEGSLVLFANVVFRFCILLFELEALDNPLSRFIASRPLSMRLRDVHEELDHLSNLRDYKQSIGDWRIQWEGARQHQSSAFLEALSNDVVLANGFIKYPDAAILLQQKLSNRGGQNSEDELRAARHVLERSVQVCHINAPVVPEWFLPRNDVDFQTWNVTEDGTGIKKYHGKWFKRA